MAGFMISFFLLVLFMFSALIRPHSSHDHPTHSVLTFGATNDFKLDSTTRILEAWTAACRSDNPKTIHVPKGTFVLRPVMLKGPCRSPNMKVVIDGTLLGPSDYNEIANNETWIGFHGVDGLSIGGSGRLDARGQSLWNCKAKNHGKCPKGGRTLALDNSKNIEVKNLEFWNSQMFHITINACENIRILGVNITADEASPNTDGIHIEKSKGVTIMHTPIQTGDDCISAGRGTQNLWIEDIWCGPGHGISIGSLGRNRDEEGVRNITAKKVTFKGTDNGFRIKTWSEPYEGFVRDVRFENAVMYDVSNPIIIDQHYCPFQGCECRKNSEIRISNILYKKIRGTSATDLAIRFDCSPSAPCWGIVLEDIHLMVKKRCGKDKRSRCERMKCAHSHGKAFGHVYPKSCLAS